MLSSQLEWFCCKWLSNGNHISLGSFHWIINTFELALHLLVFFSLKERLWLPASSGLTSPAPEVVLSSGGWGPLAAWTFSKGYTVLWFWRNQGKKMEEFIQKKNCLPSSGMFCFRVTHSWGPSSRTVAKKKKVEETAFLDSFCRLSCPLPYSL